MEYGCGIKPVINRLPCINYRLLMKEGQSQILAINSGSSSIKFSLYQHDETLKIILSGKIERIGTETTSFVYNRNEQAAIKNPVTAKDLSEAALFLIDWLEKEVSFKLTETGAEIPPDALNKIFDRPFNTVTKPTAQNTDSSAISLSGVYDIVGMHGGRVFVNSIAGQGATFLFTLPAVMSGEENSHEQAVNSSRRRR